MVRTLIIRDGIAEVRGTGVAVHAEHEMHTLSLAERIVRAGVVVETHAFRRVVPTVRTLALTRQAACYAGGVIVRAERALVVVAKSLGAGILIRAIVRRLAAIRNGHVRTRAVRAGVDGAGVRVVALNVGLTVSALTHALHTLAVALGRVDAMPVLARTHEAWALLVALGMTGTVVRHLDFDFRLGLAGLRLTGLGRIRGHLDLIRGLRHLAEIHFWDSIHLDHIRVEIVIRIHLWPVGASTAAGHDHEQERAHAQIESLHDFFSLRV